MPNYCDNDLKITGKLEDVEKFMEDCISVTLGYKQNNGHFNYNCFLDFEKILPTPTQENGEVIDEWYRWRINNWGTKWNVCDTYDFEVYQEHSSSPVELTIGFTTAWGPADQLYEHLAHKYKDTSLEFTIQYYEGGCAFAGELSYHKGEETNNFFVEYKSGDTENNIKYYTYLIEEELEDHEWMSERIEECMNLEDATEEEIEDALSLFNEYYRRNKCEEAARLFVEKTNY